MKIVAKILIFMHFLSLYHTINTYNFVLNYCVKYSYYNNISFKHFRITLFRRERDKRNSEKNKIQAKVRNWTYYIVQRVEMS